MPILTLPQIHANAWIHGSGTATYTRESVTASVWAVYPPSFAYTARIMPIIMVQSVSEMICILEISVNDGSAIATKLTVTTANMDHARIALKGTIS